MKEPTPRQGLIRFLLIAAAGITAMVIVSHRNHRTGDSQRSIATEDSSGSERTASSTITRDTIHHGKFRLLEVSRVNDSLVLARFETDLPDGFQVSVTTNEIFQGLEDWNGAEAHSGIAVCSLSILDGKWMYKAKPSVIDVQRKELRERYLISPQVLDTVWKGRFKLGTDASIALLHAKSSGKRIKWLRAVRELNGLIDAGRRLDRIYEESAPQAPENASFDDKLLAIYLTANGPYGSTIRRTIARWQHFRDQIQSNAYEGLSTEFTNAATHCLQCIQQRNSDWCDSVELQLQESPEWRLSQPRNP